MKSDENTCSQDKKAWKFAKSTLLYECLCVRYVFARQKKKQLSLRLNCLILRGGPARAWTWDLQIMSIPKWYFVIFCYHESSLKISGLQKLNFLWISKNTPNWNKMFTHCLRRSRNQFPIASFRFICVLTQKTDNGTNNRKNNCYEKPPTEVTSFE